MEQHKSERKARGVSPGTARRRFSRELVHRAREQGGMLLVVDGDAGMGKTFMLRELVDAATADGGWTATFVRADEIERNEPYSFIERFVASSPIPDWYFVPDAQTNPVELARECVQRLTSGGEAGDTIVVIDDAQWIDAESERVLRYIIPRVIRRRALFAFGARSPHAPGSFGEFLTNLASDNPLDVTHHLGPLTVQEISELVLERYGAGISVQSARRVLEATGGSFLGVDSVLSSLTEREIAQLHLSWDTAIRVDVQSDSPLLHHFRRLGPEAQRSCELVCLAGHELTREHLREASKALGEPLALDEAIAADVLVESGYDAVIMPRHALLGEAIGKTVPPERARPMFRALAATTSGHRSLRHLIRGAERWDDELWDEVNAYVREEAENDRLANASEVLREALALATDPEVRMRLIEDLLIVHMQAKTSYFALDLLEEVEQWPKSILHEVLSIILAAHQVGRELPIARVHKLLAMQPSTPDERVVMAHFAFMVVILNMRTNDHAMVPQLIALAKMLTAQTPDDRAELSNPLLGWMLDKQGQLLVLDCYQTVHDQLMANSDAVKQALPGLVQRAETIADSAFKVDALVAIAGAEISVGDVESGRRHAQQAVELLESVGLPWAAGTARIIVADCMVLQGDFDAATEFIDLMEELAYTTMDVETRPAWSALRVRIAAITDEGDGGAHAEQARRQRTISWEGYAPDLSLIAECEVARASGDAAGVLAASSGEWADRLGNTKHGFLTYRAHALIDTGRLEEAEELIDRLADWRGVRWLEYWGTLDWLRARLAEAGGDAQTAIWHYEAAIRNREFPLPLGLTLTDFGQLLMRLGRRDEAAERLDAAMGELERIGADGYLPRVRKMLGEMSESRGSAAGKELLASLTDRERQVVAQLAKGRSNNQIAESLVVSVATVRSHVSNVLRKLRLSSRGEVVRLLRDETSVEE